MSRIEQLIAELCPDGVEFKELGKIVNIINGFAFKSKKYSKEGIRVIRISDVQKGRISNDSLKFYPTESQNEIKNYLLNEDDLVMSLTGNVGRVAIISKEHLPAGLNQRVACIRAKNKNELLIRYLFHLFDMDCFERDAMNSSSGAGQKNMSTIWLSSYKIPIPPLPIQQEIVRILDTFTDLDAELQAELEARKKQYEHYRNQLLNFEGKEVEWKTLGEVGKVCMCKRVMKHETNSSGEIPFYKIGTFGKEANAYISRELYDDYKKKFSFPCKGDILISASGTIGRRVIYDDKPAYFQDSNIIWLSLTNNMLLNKYLYYIYETIEWPVEGGTIKRLYNDNFKKIKIPIPPLAEQERIVSMLDKFEALVNEELPAEISARRKQYEHYREKLLAFEPLVS
ncbi:MAG: restriction endonuclease subunit S [Fibrobacter sp.]|nr:restriction endonuclease subunit S [Fibrobacter sp.]